MTQKIKNLLKLDLKSKKAKKVRVLKSSGEKY